MWLMRALKQAQAPAASSVDPGLAQQVLAEVSAASGWRLPPAALAATARLSAAPLSWAGLLAC